MEPNRKVDGEHVSVVLQELIKMKERNVSLMILICMINK